jgi:adducin
MPTATNGTHIESPEKKQVDIDDNDDDRRELDRPADVVEDMRQMGQRQRVKTILNSKEFRDELEEIITDALKHGPHPASLIALQQISELLLPHTSRWTTVSSLSRAGGSVIVPINDIRGVDSQGYSKSERLLRCKLASLYRLVDLFGWSQGIYNHITARVNQEQEHFLINPFGLMYHEVTGSSLVKVDIAGNMIDPGSTTYGINRAGYTLHSAIHKARPDLKCIIHLHTPAVAAVSAMKCGLLPLSQDALFCGKISYHDYRGILIEDDVKKLLVEDLGPINKVMILRNHGFVACGETIEEAWKYAYNVINACEVQIRAVPLGIDQLYLPSNEQQKRIADVLQGNVNEASGDKKWKIGELEFESLMRILDNAGFRTGYVYRQPLIRTIDKTTTFKDIEVPPAASSATSFVDPTHPEAYSPTRQTQRTTEWRNSPNAYLKQEIEETGTPNPKKVTKWVPDTGLKHSTPIKIDTKHQFAPSNVNPKELKNHQKQIKEDRFNEKISAGYQSKILDNAAWDDVSQMKDPYQPSSEAVVVVGAASKGIIKRDQQNNAIVYKTYYGQNPFAHMDNDQIEKYKREVEQNQMREQGLSFRSFFQFHIFCLQHLKKMLY